jgi:hypothetical protein
MSNQCCGHDCKTMIVIKQAANELANLDIPTGRVRSNKGRANYAQTNMATETIGKYQLHLFAYELSGSGWEPYIKIDKFDDTKQDFICVLDKHRVTEAPVDSYDTAIEAARRAGNQLILDKKV